MLPAVAFMLLGITTTSFAQTVFEAQLSGSNEANPITTAATGNVTATLNGNELKVTGSFENLSSNLATDIAGGAHIHAGMAGESGGVLFPLTVNVGADSKSGTFMEADNTFTLTSGQVDTLMMRGLYINIHSENYTGGELRGQLLAEADAYYRANLSGAFESPSVKTMAGGTLNFELKGDSLFVSGTFANLEGEFDASIAGGSHLHMAPAGSNGSIALSLTAQLASDNSSGTYLAADNAFELTAEQKTALMNREFYVNIHTTAYAAGELRGQVVPAASTAFFAQLSGSAEIPSVHSGGSGAAVLELHGDTLKLSGSFSGLESAFNAEIAGGSHLHFGHAGENGSVGFSLNAALDADLMAGAYITSDNSFELTAEQKQMLLDRKIYINIHTLESPSGELRGQVMGEATAYFHANLAGIHEVQPIESSATGATIVEYTGSSIMLYGGFHGMSSAVATDIAGGAHLHSGAVNANGSVEIPLNLTLSSEDTAGVFVASENMFDLSEEQETALFAGGTYINIHTTVFTGGELRGQVLFSPNTYPAMVSLTAPENGVSLTLDGESSTAFEATWESSSDADNNDIAYIWQLATDVEFSNIIVNANVGSDAMFSTTYGVLDSLLNDLGIEIGNTTTVYHRVVVTDGSDEMESEPRTAMMERGTVTSNEEDHPDQPNTFALNQNYPNPFNPTTNITFSIEKAGQVSVTIYNMLGQQVGVLLNERLTAGSHTLEFDASALSSGIYIYRLKAGNNTKTKKMTLIK